MTRADWLAAAAWLQVGILLGIMLHGCADKHRETALRTETVTSYDTVTVSVPVPRDSVVVRYVRRVLPTAEVTIPADTAVAASATIDSATVEIPITQKEYADSTYTAWVSGYEPQLDSIKIYRRTTELLPKAGKDSRWGVGITAGYGCSRSGLTPYVGVGISYRLFGL
jgi:hypothetical protein